MRVVLLLGCSLAITGLSACCGHRRPGPEPMEPTRSRLCVDRPEIADARACLEQCRTAECRGGCCHRLAMVDGTDKERAALRSCIRECTPP